MPSLVTLSLYLSALAFGGFGTWLLLWPEAMGALGLDLTTPAAVTEIRAFYGGLELGCAGFFLVAARRPAWHTPGLMLQATSLGGAALARLGGVMVDGTREPIVFGLMAAEAVGASIAVWLLWRTAVARHSR
jgi:hypothetical protein